MYRGERRLRTNTAIGCLFITLLVVAVDIPRFDLLRPMEHWLYDRRARYCQFFMPEPTDKLVHLDLDEAAIDDLGLWPWPRETMAGLLDEIHAAGPKAVALDILYSEGERPEKKAILDGDAALAEAIRRAGNVVLSVSLQLDTNQTKIYPFVRSLMVRTGDLEMTEAEVARRLAKEHPEFDTGKLDAQVADAFVNARRDAAPLVVDDVLDEAEAAAPKNGRTPLEELQARLLHKTDAFSPQGRLVQTGYEKAVAQRAARRFNMPTPGGLPPLSNGEQINVPVPAFSAAASAEGFVDYPPYRDGHVRSVPLFMQFGDGMLPQIGFALAAKMLDAGPSDIRVTPTAVTLVGKGKGGKDLVIPVRTHRREDGGPPIPLTFDVPWSGTADWARMYPRQPHLSMGKVYGVLHTRKQIAENARKIDQTIEDLLRKQDAESDAEDTEIPLPPGKGKRADRFLAHPPGNDPVARAALAAYALKPYGKDEFYYMPEDLKPESEKDPERQLLVRIVQNLRQALKEQPRLRAQLDRQRAELKSDFGGKAVIIGWAATGAIADRKPTSIHPEAPGVVVHGTIVNALLTGEVWHTLPWAATAGATLLLGLLVTAAVVNLPTEAASTAAAVILAAYLVFNGIVLFDYGNTLLGLAAPIVVIGAVWGGGTTYRLRGERAERRRITKRFSSYVDPELVNFVLEHADEDIFTGVEREMTVVFNDLAGFTALSERLGKQIIPVLNDFMSRATKVITKHHGLVNKFLGDGVMFFFNAPRDNPAQAADAIATVLELQDMLADFNRGLAEQSLPQLTLRTGVATGLMVVGDAGSSDRCDYTVLGDTVNLSARLESANKAVGTINLMTERTIELAGDPFLTRPVGRIQVVGQTIGVTVYEALALRDAATPEQKRLADLTREMVQASLDGRPADCLEAVTRLEEAFGETKLTHLYRDKCECYLKDPNAGEYDRQIVLTSK